MKTSTGQGPVSRACRYYSRRPPAISRNSTSDDRRHDRGRNGAVFLVVVLLSFVALFVVGGLMNIVSINARMTHRSIDYQRARIAAEAAMEYGLIQLRDTILSRQFDLGLHALQTELDTRVASFLSLSPVDTNYVYLTPAGNPTLRITVDSAVHLDELIQDGIVGVDEVGVYGDFQYFTIHAAARNPRTGVGAGVKLRLIAKGLFLIRFAIFYDKELEFHPGPQMTVWGPVHSNGELYLQAGDSLVFSNQVTCSRRIFAAKGLDGRTDVGTVSVIRKGYQTLEPFKRGNYYLDSSYPTYLSDALDVWNGNLQSMEHGVGYLRPPISPLDDPSVIIQRSKDLASDPDYQNADASARALMQATENEKFANKASLIIKVAANGSYTVKDQNGNDFTSHFTSTAPAPAIDPATGTPKTYNSIPLYEKDANGHYSVSGSIDTTAAHFSEGRQKKTMAPVDLYMDRIVGTMTNLVVNGGTPGLLYVTRDAPSGGRVPCVRIRNGSVLARPNGITIASDAPVYIEGHFNRKTAGRDPEPTMVAGDSVTMLSPSWQDAYSSLDITKRPAVAKPVATECYAVLMTGHVMTKKDNSSTKGYSGGVENEIRFLENWSGVEFFYRGSLIDLWYSQFATAIWGGTGKYYNPPNRNWGYDTRLRRRNPPGMTRVFGLEELLWSDYPWDHAVGFFDS